jgi:tripartite-type tricarboxylate transporter receptor subunit TctC
MTCSKEKLDFQKSYPQYGGSQKADPPTLHWSNTEAAMRKLALLFFITGAIAAAVPRAFADGYPTHPITLIVPYAAGGGVDVVARALGDKLGEKLGQKVIILNITGAGGLIGTERAEEAAPDGYTLLFAVENTMAVAKLVQPKNVHYDAQKDFAPISLIGTAPLVLVGKNDLPANNIAELMKLLKANPGKYSFASSGVGTSLHVLGEMINVDGKVKMVHVPYSAAPQIVTDLMGNQIDLAILPLNLALPAYKTGALKIFGESEQKRSSLAPEMPSLAEEPDLSTVDMTVWYALFAPAKVDPAIIDQVSKATAEVLHDPEVKKKFAEVYLVNPIGGTPAELATFLGNEIEKFSVIVKAANIKTD